MPFPTTLTTGQLAQLRQRDFTARQFLLLTPNDIVWQTRPNDNVDGSIPYASFDWNTTVQGDRDDVKEGQTVLISTGTDLRTTTVFRGRVRLVPDATTFYINETSVNLATTYYVTVLDDWDIHERLERRIPALSGIGFEAYKDWAIEFTRLPPIISDLQSVYADLSGAATVELAFAPTVTAGADGASISTYLWDVADGAITVGTDADKDITVEFPGAVTNEHRWVTLTVTDDLGTSQYFAFEVYTIDLTDESSSVIKLAAGDVNITGTRSEGFNASCRVWDGFSAVLTRTRCAVVSLDDYGGVRALAFTSGGTTEIAVDDEIEGDVSGATATVIAVDLNSGSWAGGDAAGTLWINDQVGTFEAENLDVGLASNLATIAADSLNPPITQNVTFVGRVRRETDITRGDEIHAQIQDATITLEGFATQLGRTVGPGLYLETTDAATAWGTIQTMTVGRALHYMLAWHSTFLNVCSWTLPSDIDDYEWNEYTIPPAGMLPWITSISDDINAWLVFAPAGESTIQRHASYTGVGGLTTIANFVIDNSGDSDLAEITFDYEYISTKSQAVVGAATYNTTESRVIAYRANAPAQTYGPGWETAQLDQQIMKSDLTEAQAKAEAGSRVANHLAYENTVFTLSARLPSGCYWLVPCDHQLYTFDIPATDNPTGYAITSAIKWLCTSIDYRYSPDGYYDPYATFALVTSGGSYGITVTQIVDVSDLYPDLPPLGAGLQPTDPLVNYPDDDPDYELPGFGSGDGQPGNPDEVEVGCDLLNVSMKTGAQVSTHNATDFGETYTITVQGDGVVDDIGLLDTLTIDSHDPNNDQTTVFTSEVGTTYTFVVGTTVIVNTSTGQKGDAFYTSTDNWVTHDRDVIGSSPYPCGEEDSSIEIRVDGATVAPLPDYRSDHTYTFSVDGTGSPFVVRYCDRDGLYGNNSGSFTVYIYNDEDVRGDAFYLNYQSGDAAELYNGTDGLVINGAKPGTIPVYQSSHKYIFPFTGTGNVLAFEFNDDDYSDNSNSLLSVKICGPGMALTAL